MIFSSKAEYGVRLMVELGRQSPEQPTSLKAIADAEGLPLAYLEQVVARLRKAGLVRSARGAHGRGDRADQDYYHVPGAGNPHLKDPPTLDGDPLPKSGEKLRAKSRRT